MCSIHKLRSTHCVSPDRDTCYFVYGLSPWDRGPLGKGFSMSKSCSYGVHSTHGTTLHILCHCWGKSPNSTQSTTPRDITPFYAIFGEHPQNPLFIEMNGATVEHKRWGRMWTLGCSGCGLCQTFPKLCIRLRSPDTGLGKTKVRCWYSLE